MTPDPTAEHLAARARLIEQAKGLLASAPAASLPDLVVDLMILAVAAERRRVVQSINGVVGIHGPAKVVELILAHEVRAMADRPREV